MYFNINIFLCHIYDFMVHYLLLRLATNKCFEKPCSFFHRTVIVLLGRVFWRSPCPISNFKQNCQYLSKVFIPFFVAESSKTSKERCVAFLENQYQCYSVFSVVISHLLFHILKRRKCWYADIQTQQLPKPFLSLSC